MMAMEQLEFPFTLLGREQERRAAQQADWYRLYQSYAKHVPCTYQTWYSQILCKQGYPINTIHETFRSSYPSLAVDLDNDEVKKRFERGTIHDTNKKVVSIEDYMV